MSYKVNRTNLVLLAHSNALRATQDAELAAAVAAAMNVNYDFERLDPKSLELLTTLDMDEIVERARDEFMFFARLGSIIDHQQCVGTCALCGKGDSKGDGTNRDQTRYSYALTNTGSGDVIWVGRSCIVRFGLRVEGAATAAEAEKILRRVLRDHMEQWRVAEFVAAYPHHEQIPDDYRWAREAYLRREGMPISTLKSMRRAERFYVRRGRLTPPKVSAWERVRALKGQTT